MRIYSSLWNADDWATRGGLVKTDWSKAPFTAYYRNFNVSGSNVAWRTNAAWETNELNAPGRRRLRWVQKYFMIYNYCTDLKRFPQGVPPECRRQKNLSFQLSFNGWRFFSLKIGIQINFKFFRVFVFQRGLGATDSVQPPVRFMKFEYFVHIIKLLVFVFYITRAAYHMSSVLYLQIRNKKEEEEKCLILQHLTPYCVLLGIVLIRAASINAHNGQYVSS